jgi:Flp pilus assembly protein TadB
MVPVCIIYRVIAAATVVTQQRERRRTKTMKNDNTRCSGRERVKYWNIICEKDKKIDDLIFEHRRELAEKDKTIAYYRKAAEQATDRKQRAIRDSERRAKLNFSYATLIIVGMAVIPWLLWLIDTALKSFWLWAN